MIHLCYDQIGRPNLAIATDGNYDTQWPFTVLPRLSLYLKSHEIPCAESTVEQAPVGAWYPIGISWFDHSCDYMSLMTPAAIKRVQNKDIRLLFYYHEGDNPQLIIQRLNQLCDTYSLPRAILISANTAADQVPQGMYFPDHEYFFRHINRFQVSQPATDQPRDYTFTALNRTHKWWRATVMSELKHAGYLDQSLWSYNTHDDINDLNANNPIRAWHPKQYRRVLEFIAQGPYVCDTADVDKQNQHSDVNQDLFTNSYCNIVLETLYDADQSSGAFLTEKTFKPIKYGQPFVIIGSVGSLAALRTLGYRTFDHVIDNSYDDIHDNRDRWTAIQNTIAKINNEFDRLSWFRRCLPDILHNQQVFASRGQMPLNQLIKELNLVS